MGMGRRLYRDECSYLISWSLSSSTFRRIATPSGVIETVFRPFLSSIWTKPWDCSCASFCGSVSPGWFVIWGLSWSSVMALFPMPLSFHMAKRSVSWGSDRLFVGGMVAPYSSCVDISISDMKLQCLLKGTLIYQLPCHNT